VRSNPCFEKSKGLSSPKEEGGNNSLLCKATRALKKARTVCEAAPLVWCFFPAFPKGKKRNSLLCEATLVLRTLVLRTRRERERERSKRGNTQQSKRGVIPYGNTISTGGCKAPCSLSRRERERSKAKHGCCKAKNKSFLFSLIKRL
jgi:hypothetical protein